jgi:hypothetical protein
LEERQNFFNDLSQRFEAQGRPVQTHLDVVKDTKPPDPGTLNHSYTVQKNMAVQRAKRLEETRAKVKSCGKAGEFQWD